MDEPNSSRDAGNTRSATGGGGATASKGTALLTEPSGNLFRSLFDLDEIQHIQDQFTAATGVASIITTTEGHPITAPSNFCRLCRDIIRQTEAGRANCFRSDALIGRHQPDGPTIQPCLSGGLWDAGASITVGDTHIANWLVGQVRNEATDLDRMRAYAREIGADEQEFLAALEEVTVMSREQFGHISAFLFTMANQLSRVAYQNQQQGRLIGELGRAEAIISRSPAVAFHWRNASGWPVDYVTANVESLFGYNADDFTSGRVPYEQVVHPADLDRVAAEVAAATADSTCSDFTHTPYRIRTHDGSTRWVEDTTHIVRDDAEVTGYQGIVVDVTERMLAEQERAELKAQLQRSEKMETVGALAGGVAHDLNNILGAIVGYPDLLLLDLPASSPLREPLQIMRDAGQRAADIVQDLLTLTRRGVVGRTVLDLNQVLQDYLRSPEHQQLLVYHPAVTVRVDLQPELLHIEGSATHLHKTAANLVANALEAMPQGGTLTLRTESRYLDRPVRGYDTIRVGEYVVLQVADQGVGIAQVDLERIFEPFYTKKAMGRSGTGLGMAVVWGTVKDHDGYIDVASTQSEGTTFSLYFPSTRKELPGEVANRSLDSYRGRGQRILVVDDDAAQRLFAGEALRRLDYRVQIASSGEEALVLLREQPVDLLVLDMIMEPGMDGLATYRQALGIHPQQRAVIVSGYAETDRVREAQRLGAGPYLRKPYSLEQLGLLVQEELAREE